MTRTHKQDTDKRLTMLKRDLEKAWAKWHKAASGAGRRVSERRIAALTQCIKELEGR